MGMNPRWKQPWIDALESGEYQQTRGVLHNGVGYCCLGVLCRVAGATFQLTNNEADIYEPTRINGATMHDVNTLSCDALAMFGLDDNQQNILVGLNDGVINGGDIPGGPAKTFKEIAAYIRENL